MMVLVDTPIWSLALRRQGNLNAQEQRLTHTLEELIREGRAQLLGPIRQELLSGVREEASFRRLCSYLRAFDEPGIRTEDYEEAARSNNLCRAKGIAGSSVDFLICAVAYRRDWAVFTTDRDLVHYAKILPIKLHALA
jgi:hypothetical protein